MSTSRKFCCQYCGTGFTNRSNKYRHERKYCDKIGSPSLQQEDTVKRKKISIKIKSKSKNTPNIVINEQKSDNDAILEELKDLRARVNVIENEPRSYNNWIIIGTDMFHDMINKFGKEEAVSFLTQSAVKGDSIDVVKKLYLDGVSPEKYPIACKNSRHFRYLNDKREIIDDKGGQSVQKMFSDNAHRAMVLATNEMIKKQLDTDTTEKLYVNYDIGDVQCRLATVHKLDIDRLAGITNNPNHPFFVEEDE